MKIQLQHIAPDDERLTAQLEPGEVVAHDVKLEIGSRSRTFAVYLKANVLPDIDASVIHGDKLLEELFRFDPAGLSELYRAVARCRRGERLALPLVLVEAEAKNEKARPGLERLVISPQTL